MRIHVIYGQGGFLTSGGMYLLAQRLRSLYPKSVVQTWNWSDSSAIVADIVGHAGEPVILIGYSLGANAITWISSRIPKRTINLAVAYDPSVLTTVLQPGPNIKRLLLYHNLPDLEPEGHAVFRGPQVETTSILLPHLLICWSQSLHAQTLAAIAKVAA